MAVSIMIRSSRPQCQPAGGNYTKTYITIHETGNKDAGAGAKNHANWLSNGADGEIGYHYTVDDHEIYHHIPDNEKAWHAGDGGSGTGNLHSIGIELCVNADGDFEQTKKNAAWLVAKLMEDYSIPINNVVQHNHWSGKNCPRPSGRPGPGTHSLLSAGPNWTAAARPLPVTLTRCRRETACRSSARSWALTGGTLQASTALPNRTPSMPARSCSFPADG